MVIPRIEGNNTIEKKKPKVVFLTTKSSSTDIFVPALTYLFGGTGFRIGPANLNNTSFREVTMSSTWLHVFRWDLIHPGKLACSRGRTRKSLFVFLSGSPIIQSYRPFARQPSKISYSPCFWTTTGGLSVSTLNCLPPSKTTEGFPGSRESNIYSIGAAKELLKRGIKVQNLSYIEGNAYVCSATMSIYL